MRDPNLQFLLCPLVSVATLKLAGRRRARVKYALECRANIQGLRHHQFRLA